MFFGFHFCQPGPGDFRVCEDDGWDGDIIEFGRFANQRFDSDLGFSSGFVSQHWFAGNITNSDDGWVVRFLLLVDLDEAAFVQFDLCVFQTEVLAVWEPANRDKNTIERLR